MRNEVRVWLNNRWLEVKTQALNIRNDLRTILGWRNVRSHAKRVGWGSTLFGLILVWYGFLHTIPWLFWFGVMVLFILLLLVLISRRGWSGVAMAGWAAVGLLTAVSFLGGTISFWAGTIVFLVFLNLVVLRKWRLLLISLTVAISAWLAYDGYRQLKEKPGAGLVERLEGIGLWFQQRVGEPREGGPKETALENPPTHETPRTGVEETPQAPRPEAPPERLGDEKKSPEKSKKKGRWIE